jgi:hypothetical protein
VVKQQHHPFNPAAGLQHHTPNQYCVASLVQEDQEYFQMSGIAGDAMFVAKQVL